MRADEEAANLTNLQPWTFIAIHVAAVNIMKNGTELLGKAASLCERTKIGVPGRPQGINATAKEDSIEIRWEPPDVPNGDLSRYKVDLCSENESSGMKCETRPVLGGKTSTLFRGLTPWTEYTISVVAQNIEGNVLLESESVNTTVKTAPAAPSKPQKLKTDELEHSINVAWDVPKFPRGPVDGYNVSWIIEDWLGRVTAVGSLVTNNRTCQLPTWKPYSNYTLSVRAFHQIGDAEPLYGDAALTAFKTAVDAPDKAKVDISVGSRSAAIFLSVAGSPNGPLDGFAWCNYATYQSISGKNESQELCANESRTTQRLLLLEDLKPWTSYTFAARAYNLDSNGTSMEGPEACIYYTTEEDAPSTPRNFSVARFESRSLILNWSEPQEKNGELEGYILTWSLSADGREINRTDISPRSTKISSLEPYTEYTLQLRAYNKHKTKRFEGPPVRIHARTLPEAPGPIVDLDLVAFKNNTVHLTWRPPLQKRGELQSYVVIYNATKPGKPTLTNVPSELLPVASVCHGMPAVCTFDVEELPAEYVYTFDVRGINVNVSAWGDALESPIQVEVPAGDPPPPKNVSMVAGDCPSAPEPDTQKKFMISNDMFDDINGDIRRYDVVIGSAELIDKDVESGIMWKEVSRNQPTPPHVITPQDWNPFAKENHDQDPLNCEPLRGREGTMICTIGSEICDDNREVPCNGPLRGGAEYAMYVIGYTKGGSRASSPEVFVTALPEEPSSAGAIAGGILTAIVIMAAILAVFVIHRRRLARQKQANSKRASADAGNMNNSLVHLVQMSDVNGSGTKPSLPAVQDEQIEMEHHVIKDINKPIPKIEFRSHLAMMMKDSAYRFADEYERLVELSPQYPSDVARHPANSKKNRFTNIHPFDRSRVPLSVVGEDEQSSYINASFVKGCNSDREYIAAQDLTPSRSTTSGE
ncbi:tyrosine-protein phosphatase Lar [Rhipicephalus sanguineus]|uniref:tyrosine-protein phosphatase Lar n=1 Tax=Rhipicephalus sanguineus TaxID=34632 RepID=UPI00189416EC|nr:tyrosine-protein phosphatase Lar [Rhipicephalus sanguineus]